MPNDAPGTKLAATEAYGATVMLISSYDHLEVIAGHRVFNRQPGHCLKVLAGV